jgi:hypothetical protein
MTSIHDRSVAATELQPRGAVPAANRTAAFRDDQILLQQVGERVRSTRLRRDTKPNSVRPRDPQPPPLPDRKATIDSRDAAKKNTRQPAADSEATSTDGNRIDKTVVSPAASQEWTTSGPNIT